MTIKSIPLHYISTCDICGYEANGNLPKYWGELIVRQDSYDYQGMAVADGTIKRHLCKDCKESIIALINNFAKEFKEQDNG